MSRKVEPPAAEPSVEPTLERDFLSIRDQVTRLTGVLSGFAMSSR